MISGDGFKAHDARHGPKLGQSLASGPAGLQRRLELARDRERAAALARRPAVAAKPVLVAEKAVSCLERSGGEVGTGEAAAGVKPVLTEKRGRGRPAVEGVRPWEAAGVSRRTWERRRKGGVQP